MNVILRIISMAFRHKWHMAGAYATMAGAVTAYLFLPSLFGDAIDKIKLMLEGDSAQDGAILSIFLIILALSVVRGVLSFFQTYLGERASQLVSYDIRNSFYDHVQRLSFKFHDKQHTGNLMSRAITDVENIRMFVSMGIVRMPYFASLFVIVAIILLRLDWKLGLLSISFMPFVAFQSAIVRLRMRRIWLTIQEMMGRPEHHPSGKPYRRAGGQGVRVRGLRAGEVQQQKPRGVRRGRQGRTAPRRQ